MDDAGNHCFPKLERAWATSGSRPFTPAFQRILSSGLTLGVKLPTGSYNRDADVVDRDTQIGTGSTDILLGGFHRARFGGHAIGTGSARRNWICPCLNRAITVPDSRWTRRREFITTAFRFGRVNISPVAQVIGSWRGRDNGAAADPDNSGYQRILLSPGIEVHLHPVKFYADVEFPVYQNVTGQPTRRSGIVQSELELYVLKMPSESEHIATPDQRKEEKLFLIVVVALAVVAGIGSWFAAAALHRHDAAAWHPAGQAAPAG